MVAPLRPQLRPGEMVQIGPEEDFRFEICNPEGDAALELSGMAAMLVMLIDGQRTLLEIQSEFQSQTGLQVPIGDLEAIIRQLDAAYLLVGPRAHQHHREHQEQVEAYLSSPLRPASHAGGAYAGEPDALRQQLAGFFTCERGPGTVDPSAMPSDGRLCAVVSPHIDLHRGGPEYAWAYKPIAEHSDADLFVVFGSAHAPMDQMFCATRKDFDTPLGVVSTDREFVDRLARHLQDGEAGRRLGLFEDELAHRHEHSIELQAVFLQYLFGGKRAFRMVPVLVGSFQGFFAEGIPADQTAQLEAFVAAMRTAADEHAGRVCYISGADLAHVGREFGDPWRMDEPRLAEQSEDDRRLLQTACRCDSAGLFSHVARQLDRRRVCGLAPMYTMLEVIAPSRGELLRYHQAVDAERTSCVSLASLAFYGD